MTFARQMESFFRELENINEDARRSASEGPDGDGVGAYSNMLTQDETPRDLMQFGANTEEPTVLTRQMVGGN